MFKNLTRSPVVLDPDLGLLTAGTRIVDCEIA